MSVVVAIKENGKIYMGADSQTTKGGTRTTLYNPNNYKIWKVNNLDYCLMGHVGMVRDANIVRLMSCPFDDYDEYCNNVDYRFVVKRLVPAIIDALKDARFLKMSDSYIEFLDSTYLFAYKDRLFLINSDACVIEIDDYIAIGSGAGEAIGSLVTTVGENPRKRIVKAIKASAVNDIYVDYPIVLSSTDQEGFNVVTETNEKAFLNNKEKGDHK